MHIENNLWSLLDMYYTQRKTPTTTVFLLCAIDFALEVKKNPYNNSAISDMSSCVTWKYLNNLEQ